MIAASGVPPLAVSRVLLAVALVMLVESFGRDVWWLWRHRDEAPARPAAPRARHPASTALLTAARRSGRVGRARVPDPAVAVHPQLLRAAPARGLVLVGLAVALPARARGIVSWSAGLLLGVVVLIKVFDLGFFVAFDRAFNPVEDWSYLSVGVGTVRDTFGNRDADLAVAAATVIGLAALVVPALAVGRLTRVAARHRRRLAAAGGRARRRLGDLLGVRRAGLRRRGRVDERRAPRGPRGERRAGRPPQRGSVQEADRPQGSVPQHAARPAPRGIARQGRPARVRRELRADGRPGNVVLAAHRPSSSKPATNSSRPTASRPAAAGSPPRRTAEAAGSRTPRCSRESGSTAPGAIPR